MENQLRFVTTVIYVKDNAKEVLEFYQTAFGLKLKYYDPNLDFGELDTGDTSIMVQSYKAGKTMLGEAFQPNATDKPSNVELAFMTDDVQTSFDMAVNAGAKVVSEPTLQPWGQTTAYLYSIEGTLIALVTQPPTSE